LTTFKDPKLENSLTTLGVLLDDKDIGAGLENRKAEKIENAAGNQVRGTNFQSSGEICAISSFRGDNESKLRTNFDIHWGDLRLGEAIGQGNWIISPLIVYMLLCIT